GRNIAVGDNARLTGDDMDSVNTVFAVHEFAIGRIETIGFETSDGGSDTIIGSDLNDVIFGGGGDDFIYAGAGNDLIFGDQGFVESRNNHPFDPNTSLPPVCVELGGFLEFRATNITANTGAGNDLIYA